MTSGAGEAGSARTGRTDRAASYSALEWSRVLNRFRTPTNGRASVELAITLVPFIGCWALMYAAVARQSLWLYVTLLFVAGGFLVRLFLIQHDCGHHAFFANRRANDWLGRAMGVLTLTPYEHWRRAHAIHHATHGNLDRRGIGDVDVLTVDEYRARSRWARLRYRMYRHPVVMFLVGPAYVFLLTNRVPAGFLRGGWRHWGSAIGTNIAIVLAGVALARTLGISAFLSVHAPIVLLASAIGVWLFYVQHQFEHTNWGRREKWTVREAALCGSSHYDLPPVLKWFTANIGVHHVHHLASGIPYYRMPDVLRAYPWLASVNRLTLRESFSCARLALWDECSRRLIRFSEIRVPPSSPDRTFNSNDIGAERC